MTNRRIEFHYKLLDLMKRAYEEASKEDSSTKDFSKNVYFQLPTNTMIKYPAIVYEKSYLQTKKADNSTYLQKQKYTVTVIDPNPDSIIPNYVAQLPNSISDRCFVSDNLHHDTFIVYY